MVTQDRIYVTSQKYQICGCRFNQTTASQTKNTEHPLSAAFATLN